MLKLVKAVYVLLNSVYSSSLKYKIDNTNYSYLKYNIAG